MVDLDEVVTAVLTSRRYRHVHPPLVRRLADEQRLVVGERGRAAEVVKRTKRALHQIFGAYLPRPGRWDALAEALAGADQPGREAVLREAMAQHASTRERLPALERFYQQLRARLGAPASVLDLACGLGPLAAPWLGLAPGGSYHAWDIDHQLVAFVGTCLTQLGFEARAEVVDLLAVPAWPETEVALVLKTLPCLEQQRAGASAELLRAIPAPTLVVSFPTLSLGGRRKGMRSTYRERFEALLAEHPAWSTESFEAGPELVYVVRR